MRIAFVSVALLATQIATAATPIDGWYSSLFGGLAYVPNNINKTYYGYTRNNASYENGYNAGGSLGFKNHPMRYEAEFTYISAQIDKFKINAIPQTGISGYSNAGLAMANVFYDFPEMLAAIQPYLGIGIGYAQVKAKLNSSGPYGWTTYSGSNNVFAYQAAAGLTYNFSENYALNLGYRYVSTARVNAFGKGFQANLANLGAIYRFDEGRYK